MDPASLLYKEDGLGAICLVPLEALASKEYLKCSGDPVPASLFPELAGVVKKTPRLISHLPGYVWVMKTKK